MPRSRKRPGAKRRRPLRRAEIRLLASATEGAIDGDGGQQQIMLDLGGRFAVARVTHGDIGDGEVLELSTRGTSGTRMESWTLKRAGTTASGLPLFRRIARRPMTAQ